MDVDALLCNGALNTSLRPEGRLQQAQRIPQMRHMADHMAGITMETDSYLACSMKKCL